MPHAVEVGLEPEAARLSHHLPGAAHVGAAREIRDAQVREDLQATQPHVQRSMCSHCSRIDRLARVQNMAQAREHTLILALSGSEPTRSLCSRSPRPSSSASCSRFSPRSRRCTQRNTLHAQRNRCMNYTRQSPAA